MEASLLPDTIATPQSFSYIGKLFNRGLTEANLTQTNLARKSKTSGLFHSFRKMSLAHRFEETP